MRPANGLRDFLWLRRVRNDNRAYMTGSRDVIGLWQQFMFWRSRPEVYIAEAGGARAGYLLLREGFLTECVAAPFRRLGLGSRMIQFAKTKRDALYAVIRRDNVASINLHLANGFEKWTFADSDADRAADIYVWKRNADY